MSKLFAQAYGPRAYLTLKRFEAQQQSLQPPIKSGGFPSLPSMLHRSQPGSIHSHTQLPRDAPRRSTHQTFIPLSPIWLFSRSSVAMVLLMLKASAKTWKRWKASKWLMDDSWQNSKSQTSSNLWCLDISQVTWIKIFCVSKLPAHWPWKKLLGFRVFDHHQALRSSSPILQPHKPSSVMVWFMRRASAKAWEKIVVSIAFRIHFLGPKEGFEAIPYLQTIKCNSSSSISNNNLKLRGPRACTKDCMFDDKSLQIKISYELWAFFCRISPSLSCSCIPGKYASNFPQQLIFQRNFSQTCR